MKVVQLEKTHPVIAPLRAIQKRPERVALNLTEGMVLLLRKDILCCTAESNYTHIYATGKRHFLVSKTLREIESRLGGTDFFRIHQSHLVNIHAIERTTRFELQLTDSQKLPLARSKRKDLHERLEQISINI